MRVLLIGVLLGLLQGGVPDPVFRDYNYHNRHGYEEAHSPTFDRGHIEAHPYSLRQSEYEEERIPLRDAVEKRPFEAEMSILRKSSLDEIEDTLPFSRGDVEALPAPYFAEYPQSGFYPQATVYSSQYDDDVYPLIGWRKNVESPPRTLNINPFVAFFPGLHERFYASVPSRPRPINSGIHHPTVYKSWNDIVRFMNNDGDKKVVCNYDSMAVYRPKPKNFDIKDIDPFACTHLIYAYAGIDSKTYEIVSLNHERDVITGAYKSAASLKEKNPKLKVMISVGGWNEGGMKYSDMVSTHETRTAFVTSVVRFLNEHMFDGMELAWEYAGSTSRGGKATDKGNLSILVEQLRKAFNPKGFILSLAIPPAKVRIDEGYDIMRLSKSLDFYSVMAYDLRGPWDGQASHHAPLFSKVSDTYLQKDLNLKDGVQMLVNYGAPKSKLVIGLPLYGRSFTLEHPSQNAPGSKAKGPGAPGRYTREKGYLAYYEICSMQRNGGWSVEVDEAGGPYMFKGDQWIGYENEDSIEAKVNFIKHEKLGGTMIWSIDLDDSVGLCGTRWALTSALRRALHSPPLPFYQETITMRPTTGMSDMTPTKIVRIPTTPSSPTRPPSPPAGPMPGDSCSGSAMVPKPGNCNMYLICNQGVFVERECGGNLHWNKQRNHCDWPESAKCGETKRPVSQPDVVVAPGPEVVISQPIIPQHGTVALQPAPHPPPYSGDFKMVCYFTNWSRYRPGKGKYLPADIDTSVCTHIVYGFAVLDYSNLIIKPHDSWADLDLKSYEQVTQLKARGVKVTLAIGGWNDSAGDKYIRLITNPAARAKFIDHVAKFIVEHNFDGLDLDYEYPCAPQLNFKKCHPGEKAGFAAFVKELSMKFKPLGLLLSAAVSPSKKVVDVGFDVPALNTYLDWIAVMTYDFHGHWDKRTGHVAPMYYHPDDEIDYFNMDFAIRYWINAGADPKKIVLGMPTYGQSFTLNDPNVNGLNAPASQKGRAGPETKAAGFLAYHEICRNILNGWTVVNDPLEKMGPYAYHGNQWVSFDDITYLKRKSQYIRDMKLGGGMVWALDLDDFNGVCGQGKYPLMKTIQSVLGPALDDGTPSVIIEKPMPPRPTIDYPSVAIDSPGTKIKPADGSSDLKVVCYYTNWSTYRTGEGKYGPTDIDFELCTHINYGFVVLDETTWTLKPHDKWIDVDNNYFELVVNMKNKNKNLKVLAALGGWNDSKGPKYSDLVNDPSKRRKFNTHCLEFILHYKFDGLDLDWEYPACPQVKCSQGRPSDKANFVAWLKELRELFAPHGLLLTAAVSPSKRVIDRGYDVPALSMYLDFINVMTYDFHGQWDKVTGHFSPMYAHPDDSEMTFNTNFTINYWIEQGADPKKIVMGMGMYGQSFTLSNIGQNGLNAPSTGGGPAGQYTRAKGFLAYYEICHAIKHEGWTVVREAPQIMGPYAYKGKTWVGFDDIPMIRQKSRYVRDMGLGGGMIWALDLDDFNGRCSCEKHPLLRTINRVLRPSAFKLPDPECPLLGGTATTRPKPTTPFAVPAPITPAPISPQPTYPEEGLKQYDPSVGTKGASCQEGIFRRHSNCGVFFECFNGKLQEVNCYSGLHFDGQGKCVAPGKTRCRPGVGPSPISPVMPLPEEQPQPQPQPIIPPRQTDHSLADGQPCKGGGLKSHPNSCEKFYECVHGILHQRQCFTGLHWDGKSRCTWQSEAKCQISQPSGLPPLPPLKEKPKKIITTTQTPRPTTPWFQQQPLTSSEKPTTIRTTNRWYEPWTPSTKPTTPKPTHAPGRKPTIPGKKIICYFTNWAWYRRGLGKYRPEDIDPDLCTHILYGFAVLDANNFVIKPHDSWADLDNDFYQKVTSLKAKGKIVLVALGGWNDSKGPKFSKMVNSAAARAKFISHALKFVLDHNFDGLDLDWEYPVCWQVDCTKGPPSDKTAFSAWIRELRAAFEPHNLLLSAAISPSKKVIDLAYEVPQLNEHLDFINVMTYDYHGHWDKQTGHVAPLYYHNDTINENFNANFTIHHLIERGASREKLMMGVPLYGQAFTLKNSRNPSQNSPASKGRPGEFTRAAGFLAYYEICYKVKHEGYTIVRDNAEVARIGPYAYKDRQWVGFDDSRMVRQKSEYIMDMGLGGGMIWALDLDDFNNRCQCEPHPLLRTIARVLRTYPKPEPIPDCSL